MNRRDNRMQRAVQYTHHTNATSTAPMRPRRQARPLAQPVMVGVTVLLTLVGVLAGAGTPVSAATPPPHPAATPVPGPVPKQHAQPKNMAALQNGYGPTPQQKVAMTAAASAAHTSGKPVVVNGLTTETQQVRAQPGGRFQLTENTVPVRTRQHSTWVPVNTTLHRNPDGSYSPAATAYGTVTLSGGGTTPLASTTSGTTSYTVSWPAPLPKPTVTGSTATYPNVLPGVDLAVTATVDGGFSDVLIVHTATAAHDPKLADLTLPTTVTGGRLHPQPHGGIHITSDTGGDTLIASTPLAWDSNTTLTPTSAAKGAHPNTAPTGPPVAADPSTTSHAGLAAHVSTIGLHATPNHLTLTPNPHLLTDPHTVYPVYLDPSFGWHPAGGSTPDFDEVKQGAPCTNVSLFDNTGSAGNDGQLGVGYNQWDSCIGIERTYYQWQLPTSIWGATIGNVAGQPGATVDVLKLWSASCISSTDNLFWSGGIGGGTDWNNQPGYGPAIPTIGGQPIPNGPNPTYCPNAPQPSAGFDVTSQIQTSVSNHATQFTVLLAGNESSGNNEFSRFDDNPELIINYDLPPNTPGPLWAAAGSDDVGCATQTPYPYLGKTILTNEPVLNAIVSDPDRDHLQASFTYWVEGTSTKQTEPSADNLGSGTTAQYTLPASFVSSLTNGQVVDWQTTATDGLLTSPPSQTCHFIAEPTAPSAPAITSADGRYPDNGTVGAIYGTPGQFTLASTGGDVTSMVQNLDQAPPTTNPPAADHAPFNGGATITPAGRWKLNDNTGTTAADSSGNNHPATLYGGAKWTTDSSRGAVLSLDGATGYAATNSSAVNTAGSFSVSAWADIANTNGFQTIVGQDATTNSGFYLQYALDNNRWDFGRVSTDTVNPASSWRALSNDPPAVNTWTHLVGVYDSTNNSLTLYVNGQIQGTATDTTPFQSTGPVSIGRARYDGHNSDFFDGSISDVQVYQYPLSGSDVAALYNGSKVSLSGRWTLADGTGATAADSSGNGHPATLTGGYTWGKAPHADVTLDGSTGYAATSGPVVNTAGSFTVSAWVDMTSEPHFETILAQAGTTDSGFYLQYDQADNRWGFDQTLTDTMNPNVTRVLSTSPPRLNTWTQLTGVYNLTTGTATLYVNGQKQSTATDTTPFATNGPLLIGRARYNGAPVDFFTGSVAEVQTYPTALDSSEVAQLYTSSTFPITPPSPGPHTLYGYAADAAGDASGYQSYSFTAAGDPNTTCASLAACYNNTGISPDNNTGLANFDGAGNSFSATDLTNAGWASGGTLTVDGGTYTLPHYGTGQPDNVLAANQTITASSDPTLSSYDKTATTVAGGSALEFLTSATYAYTASPGAINGDTTAPYVPAGTAVAGTYCFDSTNPAAYCAPHGTITYSDGTTQPYYLSVPDWVTGQPTLAALQAPHENTPGSQNITNDPKIYSFSVPLTSGKTITSLTLPDVGDNVAPTTAALHIFSIATRNTTAAPNSHTWTGSWASPTEGVFNFTPATPYSNETFREAIRPSLSGGTVRVKIDDALGINPLDIAHATIAVDTATSNGPTPAAANTPTNLTFGGAQHVTVPEGGMVYSDPLTYSVTANQYLLISIDLTNQIQWLVTHTHVANSGYQWNSGAGSADQTMNTTGIPFTTDGSANASTSMVTGVDVATTNMPTQAVLGDGFIDQAQTGKQPPASLNLADDLADTESTTPSPYGSIAEGMESNQVMTDYPESGGSGPALLSRIDRDILDQPGIHTVILDEGLEDILNGRTATNLVANGYTELLNYLQAAGITTIIVGLTPCDGYTGDGATANDTCTSAVDKQRTTTNTWLADNAIGLNQWSPTPLFYLNSDAAIGIPDTTNGETKLSPAADAGDHVNLTNTGFAALANDYLNAQDTWPLNDGATNTSATLATDAANNTTNPYLINNPLTGNNPLTLTGTVTWPTDPTRGTVLSLDGATGYGTAPGPVLTTTGSYSVSAWANLATLSHDADIISQDGTNDSGFALQYDHTDNRWAFTMPTSDTTNPTYTRALSTTAPTTGTWIHLVGTYNATTHTLSLYINGTLAGTATNPTPTNATGKLTIGRGQTNTTPTDYFPGDLSTIQTWNYTLTPTQITALYQVN